MYWYSVCNRDVGKQKKVVLDSVTHRNIDYMAALSRFNLFNQ